ncbi:hypothetical protein XENOCAPTIV_029496, partial [Xenoophorus captivus]
VYAILMLQLFVTVGIIDVTSCQGVLFSLCIAMLLCAITISIVVPFGYVSIFYFFAGPSGSRLN